VKSRFALVSFLLALSNLTVSAKALEGPVAPAPLPGVQWTKIQDLNPNATPTNTVIKQKWAVVIGASHFREKRLNADELGMDRAAKDFYDYLIDAHGGRFQPDHVKLMINSAATRQGILSSIGANWLGQLAGKDDLVVIFVATNAFPTTDGSTYLCAYDCALDNVYGTCISMQSLMDSIRQAVKADRIVLVLQSCYSGAAELTAGSKALFNGYNIDVDKIVLGKGNVILSSSSPNQMTWGDTFSRNLVTALKDRDGLIPLQEAFAIAQQKTEAETVALNKGKRQTPVMKSNWTGNDLVLGTPAIEKVSALPAGVMNFMSAEACYLKATNLVAAGNFDGAIEEYKKAVDADATYADALADYGAIMAIKGDFAKAGDLYKRAIAARPSDALFHANYARILSKSGDDAACRDELRTALSLNPKDRTVLTALAAKSVESGDAPNAVRYLQDAIALYPNASQLHERLSYALVKVGDIDHAVNEANEAVKLDPLSASARMNLGSAQMMQGDKNSALDSYRRASSIDPSNADVHYLLSKTLEANGDRSGAQDELNKFLKVCQPNDPRAQSARQHVADLNN